MAKRAKSTGNHNCGCSDTDLVQSELKRLEHDVGDEERFFVLLQVCEAALVARALVVSAEHGPEVGEKLLECVVELDALRRHGLFAAAVVDGRIDSGRCRVLFIGGAERLLEGRHDAAILAAGELWDTMDHTQARS